MNSEIIHTGLQRNTQEEFYTRDSVAKLCYTKLRQCKIIKKGDLILEPSAGKGVFIKYMKRLSKNIRCYDINPRHKNVVKQDFFTLQLNPDIEEEVHIFGNPPFGRQSSLARRFIKRCCNMNVKSISFILPRSFRKPTYQKCFDTKYHLIEDIDLPENAFIVGDSDEVHNVPCVFQVWEQKDHDRELLLDIQPNGYVFVKQNDAPDFSIRRVGVYAGKAMLDCTKSVQSHYFIRMENKEIIGSVVERLNSMEYTEAGNTVGPKSLSKPDIIKYLNDVVSDIEI